MNILEFDLDSLDIDNIGAWPLWVRRTCVACVCGIVFLSMYYYDVRVQWEEYRNIKANRVALQTAFVEKFSQVKHLSIYKQQMNTIQANLDSLEQQLPQTKEEAEFLEALSQQASTAGLTFLSIKPLAEENKAFYIEYPLELKLSGLYHGMGEFVSNVALMPRLVTFHDFTIKLNKPEMKVEAVELTLIAKTYGIEQK